MFYSYFYSQAGMRPAYGTSITFSGAQSTVQAVQQALQMQQQMQMQQQGIQPYYSSMEYFIQCIKSHRMEVLFLRFHMELSSIYKLKIL